MAFVEYAFVVVLAGVIVAALLYVLAPAIRDTACDMQGVLQALGATVPDFCLQP